MDQWPKLIVTCRSSRSVESCEHEIGNVIYPRDPAVRVEWSKFSGVLFVYTSLDLEKVYTIASFREYGFVENIIPVHCVLEYPPSELEFKACLEKAVRDRKVKLKVRSHGLRGVSERLFNSLIRLLNAMGVSHEPGSNKCLHVEVFEDKVYVGAGFCRPVFKASTTDWVSESFGVL